MVAHTMLADSHAYAFALVAALCIGMAKSGFSGLSLVSVFIMADIYGAKESVGIVLPLLITADLLVMPAYLKHGSWRPVWKMLGPALIGVAIGWFILGTLSNDLLRKCIGGCILLMVAIQICRKIQPHLFDWISESRAFALGAAILGGFATMLANAAGPVIQLYLTARSIPKMDIIGIGARFFLILNLLKIPLNSSLALITRDSLLDNLKVLPGVLVGILIGRWLIHRVPQRAFEWMIVTFATIAGLRLLFW